MAKSNHVVNSFINGEVSPKFFGRTDTSEYNESCEDITNFVVFPQGGAGKRNGTEYALDLVNSNGGSLGTARSFPFAGSDGTRWQVVLSPSLTVGTTITNIQAVNTQTFAKQYIAIQLASGALNNAALRNTNIKLDELQYAQSGDTLFFAHADQRPFSVFYDISTGLFAVRHFPDYVLATSGQGFLWKQMPFQDPVIQYQAPGSANYTKALTLNRDSSGNYTLTVPAGSLQSFTANHLARYYKFSSVSSPLGSNVFVVTAVTNATTLQLRQLFTAGTQPSNSSSAVYGGADSDKYFEEDQWNFDRGWPRTVEFFESRLVFGGTKSLPDTEWFSKVNNINWFDVRGLLTDTGFPVATTTADPFSITLKSGVINQINWMSAAKTLTTGTNFREFIVQGPSDAKTIGPDNIESQAQTPVGSAYVQAQRIESTVTFLSRTRRHLFELVYDLQEDTFQANNLTIPAEHIAQKSTLNSHGSGTTMLGGTFGPGVFKQMSMQNAPFPILWCLDNKGTLCGMTRGRQQKMIAWHTHTIGGAHKLTTGTIGVDATNVLATPAIQSISVSPRTQNNIDNGFGLVLYNDIGGQPDELWVVVVRSRGVANVAAPDGIQYQSYLSLERMGQEWDQAYINEISVNDGRPYRYPIYTDCTYVAFEETETTNGNAFGIIGPIPQGAGATVSVTVDGQYLGEFTSGTNAKIDISGAITYIAGRSYRAIIGFNYSGSITPVVAEVPAQLGSSLGEPRRVHEVTIHFHRTVHARFGRAADPNQTATPISNPEVIELPGKYMNNRAVLIPGLYTGDKRVHFPPGYESRPRVRISSRYPFPCNITHLVTKMVVYEG